MSSKNPVRCYLRPESCKGIGSEQISTSAKVAPARFGNRMRRWAAVGRCYACDQLAAGVAPRSRGPVYPHLPHNPRKPRVLVPACTRHSHPEYVYRGAKRPPMLSSGVLRSGKPGLPHNGGECEGWPVMYGEDEASDDLGIQEAANG